MTKIYSLNSDVKFPDMEHYDMGKASDMALYLAHCDFYPFRSVIENNKIALDAIDESYRNLAEEYIKNSINTINLKLATEKRTTNFIWNITTSLRCMMLFLILWIELLGLFHKVNEK